MKQADPILCAYGLTLEGAANFVSVKAVTEHLKDISMPIIQEQIKALGVIDVSGDLSTEALYRILTYIEILDTMKELPTASISGSINSLGMQNDY